MFLRVQRDEIIEGLQKSANIIPAKTGAAFLRTIWLKCEDGRLNIMSTDSNLEFCGSYPAQIDEPGLAGVQGRAFYELVRKLPSGELVIKSDEGKQNVLVEQGARKYKLPVNDEEWFQKFSAFPDEGTVFWSGDFLHEIIDKIAYCISDEDSMEAIACIYFARAKNGDKAIEVCGLNGHQFAMIKFVNDDIFELLPEEGVLIQKKYLAELKKWLTADEIELNISEKRLFFRTGDGQETFSLPLSYYQYPNYNNFLSKLGEDNVSRLQVDRAEMINSLERISIFNTDSNRCTHLMLQPSEVVLYSQGQETGTATESMESQYSGDMERIAFPTKNLIEILSHFGSQNVEMVLTGSEAPCGITGPDDADYQVILMPMMIQEETYYTEEDA
ncbi:DNA polymerase-3 subunit beta [Paucidesulfovibrio gracilis DSM 16080]|uniref:Beta sliding clamp n=1 Tax=Paucidesulfovibrio gracilis DSM 16080 TaxID=1121449 RepID=A0A1T4XZB9_9BACT|nr:DNA polymerase III subunit beta [Paucidesulfovibrio gracilis]SKA94375.1 DNA polymerase-3 subunit beta [Paucidesulfovibrio gracilis DSM 16080]